MERKNMQDFPENNFDAFIRKAVEEPKLSFDPEAWKAMEKKLDARPGYISSARIDLLSVLTVLIMISYLTWSETIGKQIINSSHLSNTLIMTSGAFNNLIKDKPKEISKDGLDKISPEFENHVSENNRNEKVYLSEISNTKEAINPKGKIKLVEKIKTSEKTPFNIINSNNSDLKVNKNNVSDIANGRIAQNLKLFIPKIRSDLPIYTELQQAKKISVLPGEKVEIIPHYNKYSQPKWGINFLLSPDLSAVNLSDIRHSGTNLGISLEYYLSSRWRISIGAIRSEKIYSLGNRYSSGYLSNPQNLEKIDANCSVIDIPILLRFNAVSLGKNHFFISTGFSSYLMLKEDYDYTYRNYNSTYTYSKNIRNENNHFFEIFNLSIGYEREIGRRFSLQAEPFIKAPILDIGYGKVKLMTTGAFFSLKYKIY